MFNSASALREAGIKLRSNSFGDHKAVCPHCSHSRKKKTEPCLSVTIRTDDTAVWNCHHCGWTGGAGGEDYRPRHARKSYVRPVPVDDPARPESMYGWFGSRCISKATVDRFGIYRTRHYFPQTGSENECIAFPYVWAGELRNVKYRDKAKNFAQEKNAEPVLFNADAIEPGADLIWAEGEPDVMAFTEAGFSAVVTLPNGAPAQADEASDKRYEPLKTHAVKLEQVKRVIIATDADAPGGYLAAELARRLGKDRCWRVRFPTINDAPCKDANDCLKHHGADVLRECVEQAEPWPIDGLYSTEAFADDVFKLYRGEGPKPLTTGFYEFDRAFKVLPGQFIAVTGIPNHGKSRFIDQVAVQMARLHNWKWAMFSPETGSENHVSDLCEIWSGRPFHNGPTMRMTEDDLRDALGWVRERFYFIDAKDDTPPVDWILDKARAAVIRHGIRGLVIDPYNEVEASRPPQMTETEFVSQLISKCKRFARAHDVAVFMVIHPTKMNTQGMTKEPIPGMYDMAGSAHWRNKADAGLVVYRDMEEGCSYVISKKIRRQPTCGIPGAVRFTFGGSDRRFKDEIGSFSTIGPKAEKAA